MNHLSVIIPVPVSMNQNVLWESAQICDTTLIVFPQTVLVFDELCHGFGACSYLCP
jgi:MinD superfamily P-loop ATPase